ncbi:MAG: YihY family inner membrane protein [Anaerolineales bacterium]|nr:YihY family inner membrane protein [Anaerolineales bacterium]
MKNVLQLLVQTNQKYNQDGCALLAAALAYYSFFSFFPFLLFLIYLGNELLPVHQLHQLLLGSLAQFLPTGADTISQVVIFATLRGGSLGLVGLVGLLWSASSVLTVLETALNRIWKARARSFWRKRLLATLSILALCLLFLAAISLGHFVPGLLALADYPGLHWLSRLAAFGLLVLVVSLLYSTFSNRRIPPRAAWSGGLAAAVLLVAARVIFDWFIQSAFANYGAVYGSLAWIVSLALWVYVVATLFLLGAEFGSVLEAQETAA